MGVSGKRGRDTRREVARRYGETEMEKKKETESNRRREGESE